MLRRKVSEGVPTSALANVVGTIMRLILESLWELVVRVAQNALPEDFEAVEIVLDIVCTDFSSL